MNIGFQLRLIGFGEGPERRVALKKRGCDHVHPLVRALGRQPDGKQQFVIFPVVKMQAASGYSSSRLLIRPSTCSGVRMASPLLYSKRCTNYRRRG
jgi:hypothetical protein